MEKELFQGYIKIKYKKQRVVLNWDNDSGLYVGLIDKGEILYNPEYSLFQITEHNLFGFADMLDIEIIERGLNNE